MSELRTSRSSVDGGYSSYTGAHTLRLDERTGWFEPPSHLDDQPLFALFTIGGIRPRPDRLIDEFTENVHGAFFARNFHAFVQEDVSGENS